MEVRQIQILLSSTQYSHVDISDGEVQPELVVPAGGEAVELLAPLAPGVVPDHDSPPAPVSLLEVPRDVTGESELAAQRH